MQERVQRWLEDLSQKLRIPAWAVAGIMLLVLIGAVALSMMQIDQATALPPEDGEFQTTVSGLDILLKLGLVVVLIYACLYVFGRLRGRSLQGPQQEMQVLASTRLSGKNAIHIVRVGGKTIVVGATDHHVSYLGDYMPTTEPGGEGFDSLLQRSMKSGGFEPGEGA